MARRKAVSSDLQMDLFSTLEQEVDKTLDLTENLQNNIDSDIEDSLDYVKLKTNDPLPNSGLLEKSKSTIDDVIVDSKQNLKEAIENDDKWAIETFGLLAMLSEQVKEAGAEHDIVGSNPLIDPVLTKDEQQQQLDEYIETQNFKSTTEVLKDDRESTTITSTSETSDVSRPNRDNHNSETIRPTWLEDSGSVGIQPTESIEVSTRSASSSEAVRATEDRESSIDLGRIHSNDATRPDRNGNLSTNGDRSSSKPLGASNYQITSSDDLGVGGAKTKFKNNIAALTLLKLLQAENKQATPEQQAILVKYCGWGGLAQAFDANNPDWSKEYNELVQLLPSELYEKARRSTQDSHYTPPEIIEGIYQGLMKAGFTGGSIAEPSSGTGHFIGLAPEAIAKNSQFVAVELDPLTSDIAKQLYPQSTHLNMGYQEINFPDNTFDVVVGNPPFGSQRVNDFDRPELANFSIHNYFMAKSLETLKAGGISAFVVSRHFMDSKDKSTREFIANKAHLLGAVRLPSNAFKNAGTDVTTDIIFLQKALENEMPDKTWVETDIALSKFGEAIPVNKYFARNPQNMIGRMEVTNKGRVGRVDCVWDNPQEMSLGEAINNRVAYIIPENCFTKKRGLVTEKTSTAAQEKTILLAEQYHPRLDQFLSERNISVGSFFTMDLAFDGDIKIGVREPDTFNASTMTVSKQFRFYEPKNATEAERIIGLVDLRVTTYELINLEQSEQSTDLELDMKRQRLNEIYDEFTKKYGHLNSQANRLAFKDDPSYCLLQALEVDYDKGVSKVIANKTGEEPRKPSAKKADIFSKRVLVPKRIVTHVDNAVEALSVSMNEKGKVDIPYMSQLLSKPFDEFKDELQGLIYKVPNTDIYETKDAYLTGNVKEKLRVAQASGITNNIMALESVQPADIDPVDISVGLNASWLPKQDVAAFTKHILGEEVYFYLDYQESIGKWVGDGIGNVSDVANNNTWGTEKYPANKLIESILNNTAIRVYMIVGHDEKGNPIRKVDPEETLLANQKADEIKQSFKDWVWEDGERRERLARIYNDKFNTHVPRKFDGSHLQLSALSQAINLRPHQKDAIWRGIQEGKGLFDHTVGAGKTMVMISTMIEQKRMGLINKPMAVVPNHLLLQWKDEVYKMYPDAKVLIAGKDDFTKDNRQKLFGKITTGDWDLIVIGHSSFKKIGMPPQALDKILNEQVNDITSAVAELKKIDPNSFNNPTVKRLEAFKERLETKLAKKVDQREKDTALTFDQLGVDCITVDESQEFKNLVISTSMSNVAGLGNLNGSDKAFDLFVKARYLQDKYDGKGLYFATGTSVSNTIAEVFTLQRYMQYDELKEKGIHHFDSWANTFGEVVSGWELDSTGVNYKINSRFSKFNNMPELMGMYRGFADVITQEDLQRQAEERGERFPIPKVKGGRPQNIVVERSEEQEIYMGYEDSNGNWNEGSIIHRMENLPDDPSKDNPLKITNDARKAGLDMRLIDPNAPDHPNSKVNVAIENIYNTWLENDDRKGTQLVFCDLSTPKGKKNNTIKQIDQGEKDQGESSQKEEINDDDVSFSVDDVVANQSDFSVYDDIKAKLIAKGIPEHQVRFIHEANTDIQKQKLFKDMNNGDVRILLGSTSKMGAGTNVQRKLVALHHLDCPWRPSDLEQREGRIIRQGNEFYQADPNGFEVGIYRYATKQTYDARMWQVIEQKATSIEQFRRGDMVQRTIDDVAGEAANASEMKAASTGNPLIFAQVKIASELKKVEAMSNNHKRNQYSMEKSIRELQTKVDNSIWTKQINQYQEGISIRDANKPVEQGAWRFDIPTTGKTFTNEQSKEQRQELADYIANKFTESKRLYDRGGPKASNVMIGEYRGFIVKAYSQVLSRTDANIETQAKDTRIELTNGNFSFYPDNLVYKTGENVSLSGFITRCDNALNDLENQIEDSKNHMSRALIELDKLKEEVVKPFPQSGYLEALKEDSRQVITELGKAKGSDYESGWIPKTQKEYGLDLGLELSSEIVIKKSINTKVTIADTDIGLSVKDQFDTLIKTHKATSNEANQHNQQQNKEENTKPKQKYNYTHSNSVSFNNSQDLDR